MTAPEVRLTSDVDQQGRILLRLSTTAEAQEAFFQSGDIGLVPNNEALITAGLLPCMVTGNDMLIDGPVSQRYLEALRTIIDIYHAWHPRLRKVQISNAVPVPRERRSSARVGLFFTCGVDSWYTLLKRRDEITDLIHIHGLESRPEDSPGFQPTAQLVRRVAARLGKNVIEVDTDLRPFYDAYRIRWLPLGHGPVLISVGHLLYPEFGRIYIAAGRTYADLAPWGSHPLLDPLWSTEGLAFVHDGCEATRIEKARAVSAFDFALENLRVCFERPVNALNCGRCEKCIRTMLELLAVGALERCPAFEAGLDPGRIAGLRLRKDGSRQHHDDNLSALEQAGNHPQLARAVRTALRRSRRPEQLRAFMKAALPGSYPALRRVWHLFRRFGKLARPSASGKAA